MKKILIMGGSGFIGTNLINFFLKKKIKVINLDALNYASTPDKYNEFYAQFGKPIKEGLYQDFENREKFHWKWNTSTRCGYNGGKNTYIVFRSPNI